MRYTASRVTTALAIAALVTSCSAPQSRKPLVDSGHDLVLNGVTIVDTHDCHLSPGMTIYLVAGKIASIDRNQLVARRGTTAVIEAQGNFWRPASSTRMSTSLAVQRQQTMRR